MSPVPLIREAMGNTNIAGSPSTEDNSKGFVITLSILGFIIILAFLLSK